MPHTLLYCLISRTSWWKASSTLILDLADVSMNWQPNCLARSWPSVIGKQCVCKPILKWEPEEDGKRRLTMLTDLALCFKIALVGHHDDREGVAVFDSQNLLVER